MKNALDHDVDLAIRGSSCDTERWAEKESEKLGKDKIRDRKRDNEIERERKTELEREEGTKQPRAIQPWPWAQ